MPAPQLLATSAAASVSPQTPPGLRRLRTTVSRIFAAILWLHVPVVAVAAAANHLSPYGPAALTAFFAACATLATWRDPAGTIGRMTIAVAFTAMPAILVHVAMGTYQIDLHMYFFAVYAMLAAYVDWRPVALAGALTAVHHLLMAFVMPMSVFPDQAGVAALPRVVLHAAIVIVECGVLIWMSVRFAALFADAHAENVRATDALADASRLRAELEREGGAKSAALLDAGRALDEANEAVRTAAREEDRRIAAERSAAVARQNVLREIAQRLESTVSVVVDDVASASAAMLESARSSERIAGESAREVERVVSVTAQSDAMIAGVAQATDELSRASSDIRDRMQAALGVARRAGDESQRGADLATSLESAANRIGDVTTIIETVADQTRLLALNAAIEAARAGDSGRGFAVVADEVRKLADATAAATSDIVGVAGSMRGMSAQVSGALAAIRSSVGDLTAAAVDVATAVEEQTAATRTIAASVADVAGGTTEIRDAIERVAAGSKLLGRSADDVVAGAGLVAERNERLARSVADVTGDLLASDVRALAVASG